MVDGTEHSLQKSPVSYGFFMVFFFTVTVDAANAIKKYNVGIKCATITPDEKRVEGRYRFLFHSTQNYIRKFTDHL